MDCPQCGSEKIYRSRHRNRIEAWRKSISRKRVFRCHVCNWRGWLPAPDTAQPNSKSNKVMIFFVVAILSLAAVWLLLPYLE